MSSYYFGVIEGVLIIVLLVAFYIWQMRSLKQDVKAREERERSAAAPPTTTGHSEGKHGLDES